MYRVKESRHFNEVPVFLCPEELNQDIRRLLSYNPANLITPDNIMPKPIRFTLNAAIAMLVCFFAPPLAAADTDQLSPTELKDKWGEVIFCQKIYKMPEVRSRLYDFDIEQCDAAARLAEDLVSKYPINEQQILKVEAEKHARRLSYNTSEPYHSVSACREYCSKLAEIQEERKAENAQ